ncbi:hypothetical protein LINPERPRIM_LOCUS2904 [Linum perenne]
MPLCQPMHSAGASSPAATILRSSHSSSSSSAVTITTPTAAKVRVRGL